MEQKRKTECNWALTQRSVEGNRQIIKQHDKQCETQT